METNDRRFRYAMNARILDENGNEIGPLPQRDLFPPMREPRYWYAMNADLGLRRDEPPDDRDETIAALRAVLAPLLDDPRAEEGRCIFCDDLLDNRHAPDCPVLRRDELLGR